MGPGEVGLGGSNPPRRPWSPQWEHAERTDYGWVGGSVKWFPVRWPGGIYLPIRFSGAYTAARLFIRERSFMIGLKAKTAVRWFSEETVVYGQLRPSAMRARRHGGFACDQSLGLVISFIAVREERPANKPAGVRGGSRPGDTW